MSPGAIVRHQRQRADAHDVVRGERRQHVVADRRLRAPTRRPNASNADARPPRSSRAPDTSPDAGTLSFEGGSPRRAACRTSRASRGAPDRASEARARSASAASRRRVRADVAGAAVREPAIEQRSCRAAAISSRSVLFVLIASIRQRFLEEIVGAEVARLERERDAAARRGVIVHGTPGSICGPIASASTPSALHDRAGRLAARDHQPAHAASTSRCAIAANARFDQRAGPLAPELRLDARHRCGLRARIDQHRPCRCERSLRPSERCAATSAVAGSERIDRSLDGRRASCMRHLRARRGRATAGQHGRRARRPAAMRGIRASARAARRDESSAASPSATPDPPVIKRHVGAGGADVQQIVVAMASTIA